MTIKKIIGINIFVIIIGFIAFVIGSYLLKQHQIQQDALRREQLSNLILDGASLKPTDVTIDYSKKIANGSPLIFGGAQYPPVDQQDAWDKIADVGVTSIRVDLAIDRLLPHNITIYDYKNNINNIQNPNNWNQQGINNELQIFKNAKKRGMKVIGIVDFSTNWLSYSNTIFGVPKDWNVYEDVVKKVYKIYRPYLDYIEIWNEPNLPGNQGFLDVSGSNLSEKEAYEQIYYHASSAIREVDAEINDGKNTPLGGPVSFTAYDTSFLEPLLSNSQLAQNLDFVSYHQYERIPTQSNVMFKDLIKKYNKPDLPIFITEWSYSSDGNEVKNVIPTDAGIVYAGNMLLNYLHMGIAAANYHSITALMDNKPNGIEKYHAFYNWNNGIAELLPLARTWRLLSNQMGLGKGKSGVYNVKLIEKSQLNSVGFKNFDGQYGVAIVNSSSSAQIAEVNLNNINIKLYAKVQVYIASPSNDAKMSVYEGDLKVRKNKIKFTFYIPQESIVGMIFTEDKVWYDDLQLPIEKILQ